MLSVPYQNQTGVILTPSLSSLLSPKGTRIIYEIEHMKKLKNSPFSQTPPRNLPFIPGVTKGTEFNKSSPLLNDLNNNKPVKPKIVEGGCTGPFWTLVWTLVS